MHPAELARRIDHTLLRPEATREQIRQLCRQAVQYGFCAVCVTPARLRSAAEALAEADPAPRLCAVIDFPMGLCDADLKLTQAERALRDGACELDMCMNLAALVDGRFDAVAAEIAAISKLVHQRGAEFVLKVIIESAALSRQQIIDACRCCVEGGADFVKTSSGMHPAGGASVEQVKLIKQHCGPLRIKASGGIRDAKTALELLDAGAERLGTSRSVQIIEQLPARPA